MLRCITRMVGNYRFPSMPLSHQSSNAASHFIQPHSQYSWVQNPIPSRLHCSRHQQWFRRASWPSTGSTPHTVQHCLQHIVADPAASQATTVVLLPTDHSILFHSSRASPHPQPPSSSKRGGRCVRYVQMFASLSYRGLSNAVHVRYTS